MDIFTKGMLWDYWKIGGDEIEVSDDESSDLEEYWSDKEETAKFFKIETDVFDYETPICLAFNEFHYLLKVDPDLLTKDIMGFKTYEITKTIGSTNGTRMYHGWSEDGYCNGGNLPGAYHIRNSLNYQDLEWYEALEDSELKDEDLRNKAIMEGLISDDESSNDCWKRWKSHEIYYHNYDEGEYKNETHEEEHELCEEYVAVKEDEYDNLTITSEEACRAYQEIFRMMDEGWMVTRTETLEASNIDEYDLEKDVKELKTIDHSSALLSTIKTEVPNAVKEYLGTILDDALYKVLKKHDVDIIKEHSVPAEIVERLRQQYVPEKSTKDIKIIKMEHARKQQVPKATITSSDTTALKEFDQKTTLFETMTKSKPFNKIPKQRALYHALMESILEDEEAMDKGVTDQLKKRKQDDADKDEGPFAGSD
ncbi:hypothetical protein Tco_0657158 [Tanacetum coccineum]|uniref:Uncharacterized protein n=1 Tax=Tanacetum coccineum TaxID=301880 RepID=A0ABQ4XAS8_9ASTR